MLCKLHSSRSGIIRFGSMGIISAYTLALPRSAPQLRARFSTPYVATKLIAKNLSLQIFYTKKPCSFEEHGSVLVVNLYKIARRIEQHLAVVREFNLVTTTPLFELYDLCIGVVRRQQLGNRLGH